MKIAADYYQKGLGKSLGFLVGALVLGTALPHLLKSIAAEFPWRYVIISISAFAVLGGFVMLLLVADGPYRKPGQQMQFNTFLSGFANKKFRSAAFGYFGHMWELYSFWAFVPIMLATHKANGHSNVNVSLYSFLIISGGSIACAVSGILSQQIGTKKLAIIALALSCCCCLVSPFFLSSSSTASLLVFLFFWGMVVIADSPLFSTLVAQNVAEQSKGTSLTIVNCIGFSITIISIQILKLLTPYIDTHFLYLVLAIGPLSGLLALLKKDKQPVLNV
jgi:predicted MFS family arabinose efflux permease